MNVRKSRPRVAVQSARLLPMLMLLASVAASAQDRPAAATSAASTGMHDMAMDAVAPVMGTASTVAPAPVAEPHSPAPAPAASAHAMHDMPGMDPVHRPQANPPGPPMSSMSPMTPMTPMSSMTPMGPMQGGSAPAGARSGDYSDGIGYGAMTGMDMRDNGVNSMLLVDQFESVHGNGANGQDWEAEGWLGNDHDKLWLRSEGERRGGRLDDGDVEALWNHTLATYWSTQLGVRRDLGQGPGRTWGAIGIEGLSPYWLELEATAYVSSAGRTAARFRAEYEVLFTQRLVLQPELEFNVYGQSDTARRVRSGLSDAQLGLRLRYEISRQFAPYAGLVWTRRFAHADNTLSGNPTAVDESPSFERQWTVGVRFWF